MPSKKIVAASIAAGLAAGGVLAATSLSNGESVPVVRNAAGVECREAGPFVHLSQGEAPIRTLKRTIADPGESISFGGLLVNDSGELVTLTGLELPKIDGPGERRPALVLDMNSAETTIAADQNYPPEPSYGKSSPLGSLDFAPEDGQAIVAVGVRVTGNADVVVRGVLASYRIGQEKHCQQLPIDALVVVDRARANRLIESGEIHSLPEQYGLVIER